MSPHGYLPHTVSFLEFRRDCSQPFKISHCFNVGLQGVELDDFVSGPRELLLKLVEEHYPLPQEPKHKQGLEKDLSL